MINWDELFADETTEIMWIKFVSVLLNLTLQHIPLKSDKNNNRKDKWISNKTVKLMKKGEHSGRTTVLVRLH